VVEERDMQVGCPKVIIILKIKSTQIKLGGLHSSDIVNTLLTRRIMPQVIGFNKDMSRSIC
jgi:hypothetical protein